ncbi:MAG: TetR family transcriptional regulator [Actinomycetales bacterium]|nr:TetR family transcriptional regulator [Actinomycetales bacterium]
MTAKPRGRRPGSNDTADQILAAARELFAERGYARTTIRAIAAQANVDPALVHHYFGTKDALFDAAVQMPVDPRQVMSGLPDDPRAIGPELVRRVLGVWDRPEMQERLRGMIGSALTHEGAAETLREMLTRGLLPVLRDLALDDDRRDWRAELVAAQMAGLIVGRYVVGLPRLRRASSADLVASVGPVVSHYLTGRL